MSRFLRRAGFLSCAILAATPAVADVKQGVDAWSAGDYARAVAEWQGPAQAGDPDAMFNMAQAYKLGRGVPRDLSRAEALYQQAATKGHLGAADNYGLLLFQKGERAKAMPYIVAASDRGDPRAQYLLGLAYFNGDQVPRDWVRGYALVSLAQQAGLEQAKGALAQMDQHVPLADRQRSVPLAAELAARAEQTRTRQMAAADLGGVGANAPVASAPVASPPAPTIASARDAVAQAARVANGSSPAEAGADYTRTPQTATIRAPQPKPTGAVPKVANVIERQPNRTPTTSPTASPTPAPSSKAATPAAKSPAPVRNGAWRVQLGAFGVSGNAEKLWQKVKARPELAGHERLLVPAGRLTKLQAGGFASSADAEAACARLKAGGYTCLATRD
ncbi:SPOR domain-containing protein [Novosphingobium aquimarinum]|uniref:SPOR domain-containing protein n=1 Tax=Novosphingobium aquimarinum TaxID=2682494 RepID=UPI0012EB48EF|nr:SPOR domain-containing protein [Novosphingobium aquimarinum]